MWHHIERSQSLEKVSGTRERERNSVTPGISRNPRGGSVGCLNPRPWAGVWQSWPPPPTFTAPHSFNSERCIPTKWQWNCSYSVGSHEPDEKLYTTRIQIGHQWQYSLCENEGPLAPWEQVTGPNLPVLLLFLGCSNLYRCEFHFPPSN